MNTMSTHATPATSANAAAKAPPAGPRKIPAPRTLPESQPFWEAADAGRLVIKACLDCHAPHYYPRDICPHCQSDRTEWRETGGFGTVYSFSTMGKGEAAWTLAYVRLEEGVTMMTNLVDCDPREIEIGQRVKVVFKPSDGGYAVPMFTPA
ncbi:DNA-binding protein [Cupriavidus lacunae]|uniref:DNA-binding protein n=2 Tax=Cupriavidus lacunae TaxID=2666307 RepID=A0A370NLE9_9BURK|nr:DNA-binding protein [Cupriavidus lacunae]